MSTTTDLSTLKINYLTQAQYDAALSGGTIDENQLYLTPEPRFPIGTIEMYGGTTAPTGWLICDGSEYAIADYPALYAVIGGNFGSASDTDHFLVPDFSGRMPLGVGTGTASDATAHTLNQQDGTEGVTLDASQTPLQTHKHSHNIGVSDHAAKNTGDASQTHIHGPNTSGEYFLTVDASPGNARFSINSSGNRYTVGYSTQDHFHGRTTTGTENRSHTHEVGKYTHTVTGSVNGVNSPQYSTISAHSNMPPYLGINFIIYAGV